LFLANAEHGGRNITDNGVAWLSEAFKSIS
jgi:hypothetical protein